MALIDSISDQIQGKHMAKECLGIITWDRLMISGGTGHLDLPKILRGRWLPDLVKTQMGGGSQSLAKTERRHPFLFKLKKKSLYSIY